MPRPTEPKENNDETIWDGDGEAFASVQGLSSDEYGYVSLPELANVPGRFGIGIEIDTWFLPTTLLLAKQNR